jgi:membrane-bound metal-dependent hydrolase YbcI (DUF457 family)
MFVGHVGVALAAKRIVPAVSAGALVAAAMLIDLVWPVLLLLGIERVEIVPGLTAVNPLRFTHYPFTHSLLLVLGWALLAALLYYALRRAPRAALVLAALVVSHWVLDFITHIPDLPLWPGDSPRAGLGLWNSLAGTLLVEGALYAGGIVLYLRTMRSRSRGATIGLWAFVLLLLAIWLGSLLGPLPPDTRTIAISALALWLLPPWAHAFDRGHEPRTGAARNLPR